MQLDENSVAGHIGYWRAADQRAPQIELHEREQPASKLNQHGLIQPKFDTHSLRCRRIHHVIAVTPGGEGDGVRSHRN